MSRSHSFCNNCGGSGHAFHQCKKPITSAGVLAYRFNADSGKREYLLIKRKDSLGFVEYMRGKYKQKNTDYIKRLINEMTIEEKNKLLNWQFDVLWKTLWGDGPSQQYRSEYKESKEKHKRLLQARSGFNLEDLIAKSTTSYESTEWGIPKGRRNYQERDLEAGLREFQEETGYKIGNFSLIANLEPLEECFTGSNLKSYKHIYFLAYEKNKSTPEPFQESEVSELQWLCREDAIAIMRPYNIEKREVISNADEILSTYDVYQ